MHTLGRMRLAFLLLLLVASVQCWWPWGGDEEEVRKEEEEEEEGFKEQLERDLAGLGQEVVLESDHSAEERVEERKEEREEETKVTMERESVKEEKLSKSEEANIAALLNTPELARKLDRKAFEEKLDEVAY